MNWLFVDTLGRDTHWLRNFLVCDDDFNGLSKSVPMINSLLNTVSVFDLPTCGNVQLDFVLSCCGAIMLYTCYLSFCLLLIVLIIIGNGILCPSAKVPRFSISKFFNSVSRLLHRAQHFILIFGMTLTQTFYPKYFVKVMSTKPLKC